MQKQLNLVEIIRIIIRWKKPILIVVVIALVGSAIISDSHIMKPYYKATSVFYPSNPSMTSSQSMFVESQASGYFGNSDDVDRLIAIGNSAQLKSFIVRKFKLFDHYKIDSLSEDYPNYAVQNELEDNFKVEKTDKGAIEVTVYDHDKIFAADMANAIVAKIDDINKVILNENKLKMLSIYTNKIKDKEKEIAVTTDSIVAIKYRFNMLNGVSDLNEISSLKGDERTRFDQAYETYKVLEDKKEASLRELNSSVASAEQFKATINNDVPTIYVIEKAYPAEKKSKPIRWLVVLSSVLIAFVVTLITTVVIERYPNIKAAIDAE
jgi:capsular polysaccharide biosynthesis protein